MRNVGFDFDGVIHTEVTHTDRNGQRHPEKGLYALPEKPFNKIIKLIKLYHQNKYNIYIITSRTGNSRNIVMKTLFNFGLYDIIKENNIYFAGDMYGGDKGLLIEQLKISEFYDDSIYHFRSIYYKKNSIKYPKKFYLAIPENNDIIKLKIKP